MAINELLQGMTIFRGPGGWEWQRSRRFDRCRESSQGAIQETSCRICMHQQYWGRGDMEPFLDRTE